MSTIERADSGVATKTAGPDGESVVWYAVSAHDAVSQLAVDPEQGLDAAEAARRLAEYGPNPLTTEPPPSIWVIGRGQLSNPMNIMLIIVAIAGIAIAQVATAIL